MGNDRSRDRYEQILENLRAAQQRQHEAWAEEIHVLTRFDERDGAIPEAELRDYYHRFGIDVAGIDVTEASIRRARREELEVRLSRS